MFKHHKLISFVFGLLFLIVLQQFAQPVPIFRFMAPAFLVYAAVVFYYNTAYLKSIAKYNLWTALRPIMLLFGACGVFLVLPSAGIRGLFLIVCVGLISVFEIILGESAENILLNETLLIAFGAFFSLAALEQYAPAYGWLYVIILFGFSALLARSFFEFSPITPKTKLTTALILGLFSAQIFWCLNFLPLHFSFSALVLFNLFYACLVLSYYHIFHILNFKKIKFHLALMAFCAFVVLLATPWTIRK